MTMPPPGPPTISYQKPSSEKRERGWALVAALLVPPLLWGGFLVSLYWPRPDDAAPDAWLFWLVLAFCIGCGGALVVWSRLRRGLLIPTLIVYAIVQAALLFVLAIAIGCGVFHDCP